MSASQLLTPLERDDQANYFTWLEYQRYRSLRIADYAYAIPNGSYRGADRVKAAIHAQGLRRQGMKPGVPDVCIAIAVAPYHGCYIELKRIGARRPDKDQVKWHVRLIEQGYFVAVCFGFAAAQKETVRYFGLQGMSL